MSSVFDERYVVPFVNRTGNCSEFWITSVRDEVKVSCTPVYQFSQKLGIGSNSGVFQEHILAPLHLLLFISVLQSQPTSTSHILASQLCYYILFFLLLFYIFFRDFSSFLSLRCNLYFDFIFSPFFYKISLHLFWISCFFDIILFLYHTF